MSKNDNDHALPMSHSSAVWFHAVPKLLGQCLDQRKCKHNHQRSEKAVSPVSTGWNGWLNNSWTCGSR